jgi:hypothetical protein
MSPDTRSIKLTPRVLDEIQRRINMHHELYENITINSVYWEQILYKALCVEYNTVEWDVGSHKVGTDVVCEGINISCKGGTISGKRVPRLKVSSHRTTRHKTLIEKLKYLKLPHEDVICSLAPHNGGYRLTIFHPPDVDLFEWVDYPKKWRGTDDSGNILDIVKSMSDQYWINLDYDKLEKETYDFTVPKQEECPPKSIR